MANTKKTTTTNTNEKQSTESRNIKKLEEQIKAQQEQIAQLMAMIQDNNTINAVVTNNEDISADEEILVISLTPNKLNLVGDGGVMFFSFSEMYEEQYIDYASLKEIVRLNRDMARNGRFYILDERAVNKLRLKNNYKNVLKPEQLKKLLTMDASKAVELYKLANDSQKKTIVEIIKQAKFRGDDVDYNLLRELSEVSGVDLYNAEDATQI